MDQQNKQQRIGIRYLIPWIDNVISVNKQVRDFFKHSFPAHQTMNWQDSILFHGFGNCTHVTFNFPNLLSSC